MSLLLWLSDIFVALPPPFGGAVRLGTGRGLASARTASLVCCASAAVAFPSRSGVPVV